MKSARLLALIATLASPLAAEEACSCCAAPAASTPAAETPAPVGHPLRGVIVAVVAEKSALLVKHEAIPDVMGAMTMLLKVDATTLASAKKDQAITATLVKKADGWWLEQVAPIPAP